MSSLPATSVNVHSQTSNQTLVSAESRPTEETYVITFHLKTGTQAAFLALLEPVLNAMRNEPTFVNALLNRDPASDTIYMLYETWLDGDDVRNVQIHKPYRQAFWNALPDLLAQPRQIQVWKPIRTDLTV